MVKDKLGVWLPVPEIGFEKLTTMKMGCFYSFAFAVQDSGT